MKKIIYISIFCFLIISNKGFSQQSYISALYSVGISMGDLNDNITKPSFRGGAVEYRGYVSNNIVAGVDVGWNVYYERMDYATYSRGTASLSGVQYRYSNQWASLGTYYFNAMNVGNEFVLMYDNTREPDGSTAIAFDAMKFVRR